MKDLAIGFVIACALAFALFGGLGLVAVGALAFAGKAAGAPVSGKAAIRLRPNDDFESEQRRVFQDHKNNLTGCLIPIVTVAVMLAGLVLAKVPGLLSHLFD